MHARTTLQRLAVPALWVCAGVLAGLILLRAEPVGLGQPVFVPGNLAHAGSVAQSGGFTVLTSEALNEDLFLVLDGRNETLLVYRLDNQGAVQLNQKVALPRLFLDARARAGGK